MLLPFSERHWEGWADMATIWCLSGASVEPPSAAPMAAWREHAREQGWVAGYLQLAPSRPIDPELLVEEDVAEANAVFVLELGSRDVLAAASATIRQKVTRADRLGCALETDREQLAEALVQLYPPTMERVGASAQTAVAADTLRRWALSPSSVVLGARLTGPIEAVSVFPASGREAEYDLNAATAQGRELAAWLLVRAVEQLRDRGVESLNLGGGVVPGDGVYRFKQRFHGKERPLLGVRQVYDPAAYEDLCRRSGADPASPGRFPAYRFASEAP